MSKPSVRVCQMPTPETVVAQHDHSINVFNAFHHFRLTYMDDLPFAPQGDTDTAELDDEDRLFSKACVSNWYAPADEAQDGSTAFPDSEYFDEDAEEADTEKSNCSGDAVVSRGKTNVVQQPRFLMDSCEVPFSFPSLQDLPLRSVAGIIQWYRAASKELTELHKRAEVGGNTSCEPPDTSGEPLDTVVRLPSQRALAAHQRELLINLASSTAIVFEAKKHRSGKS